MAGTVVVTENPNARPLKRVKFAWTSSSGGAADGGTSGAYNGKCILLTTIPAAAGDAPSANYDITVLDEDGVDVLAGAGINRHTSNTEQVVSASLGGAVSQKLTLHVTAAGDTKQGVVYLDIQE